jgi:hypothetical protein
MRKFINCITEDQDEDEDHVTTLVRYAFDKLGFELRGNFPIMVDMRSMRGEVKIEGKLDGIPLSQLIRLNDSGLADDYSIDSDSDSLIIVFTVSPNMIHAVIPNV